MLCNESSITLKQKYVVRLIDAFMKRTGVNLLRTIGVSLVPTIGQPRSGDAAS